MCPLVFYMLQQCCFYYSLFSPLVIVSTLDIKLLIHFYVTIRLLSVFFALSAVLLARNKAYNY